MNENEPSDLDENAKIFYVYILLCGDGDHYTGCTSNMKERINRHQKGWVEITKDRLPVKLLWCCAFPGVSQRSLAEEIAFCMLSGFGITADLAGAAFQTCRSRGLIEQRCTEPDVWTDTLKTPLWVNGKEVHYRYPNQKAKFLADAMNHLDAGHIECGSGRALRDSLLQIKGCGHKTAGFIARNYLDSDEVAILDIHVVRAGLLLDLFSEQDTVEQDYEEMEQRYIDFCNAIQVRPSVLDCIVWSHAHAGIVRNRCGQVQIWPVGEKFPQGTKATPAFFCDVVNLELTVQPFRLHDLSECLLHPGQ